MFEFEEPLAPHALTEQLHNLFYSLEKDFPSFNRVDQTLGVYDTPFSRDTLRIALIIGILMWSPMAIPTTTTFPMILNSPTA